MTGAARLLFGSGCPQHPDRPIREVTRERVAWQGGEHWLVTAEYACGHRHTQHASAPPERVRDTAGAEHAVVEAR